MKKITNHFRERKNLALALRIYQLLSENSKKRIKAIVPVYVALSLLDLLGVILLASCGTIAFNLVSGDPRPSRVELFIRQYLKVDIESSTLVFTFAILAAVFLVSKTMLNAAVNYRMIKWMANQESLLSTKLFSSLLRAPLSEIRKIGVGDTQWAIMTGSSRIISGVVSPLVMVLGDLISILALLSTLILTSPEVTLMLVVILIFSQKLYSHWLKLRVISYGYQASEKGAALNEEIIQSFNAVKEIKIYSLTESINKYFSQERNIISMVGQKSTFLNNLFRYYLETIVIFSAFFVVSFEFYTTDTRRALTSLVLFLSVGLRIIPSLQRLQAITMSLQLSQGMTQTYFSITEQLQSLEQESQIGLKVNTLEQDIKLGVKISGLEYVVSKDEGNLPILKDISFEVPVGALMAIVGASGSGKTTLADIISGLLMVEKGSINFIDLDGNRSEPRRDLVGYCSQNPYIFDSNLEENLKISRVDVDDESISSMIKNLDLTNLLGKASTESEVTFSRRISGGERQRIGIARVFLSNRPILVFDEPTSALDKENATRFLQLLDKNRGTKTQIIVTHDLEAAMSCDQLIVLENGKLHFQGKPADYYQTKL
jgi:ABC-type bacteriocin/lantibiotic exporter with double-glycine peptidase domain